jgi:hypothetical protein
MKTSMYLKSLEHIIKGAEKTALETSRVGSLFYGNIPNDSEWLLKFRMP